MMRAVPSPIVTVDHGDPQGGRDLLDCENDRRHGVTGPFQLAGLDEAIAVISPGCEIDGMPGQVPAIHGLGAAGCDQLRLPYAGGVLSGQGVLVGALFGVTAVDGVQNAVIECQTKGVFDITKEPALAITVGARLFWDNTNRRLTTTATGNFQVGLATVAALAADATVRAVLQRIPAIGT